MKSRATIPVVAETTELRKQGEGTWAKLAIELGPRLPFGYNPQKLAGNQLRSYVARLSPQVEWNIYETRWHPLPQKYDASLKQDVRVIGQDVPETLEAVKTYLELDPSELAGPFKPGESIEVERYGAAAFAEAPVAELLRFGRLTGPDFGLAATAGFTSSLVFHYYRCGIEVLSDTKSRVTYTRLITYPDEHGWQKILGQSFGFVVGIGPFVDIGPFSEDWLLPKWAPITWTRYGVQVDILDVDRTGPGLLAVPASGKTKATPAVSVAQALKEAYREGKPAHLFEIAKASSQSGKDLGVTQIETDLRLSKRTDKNDLDVILYGRSNPSFGSDVTRTTYPNNGKPMRLLSSEFQNNSHGVLSSKDLDFFRSKSIDVAVRTTSAPGATANALALDEQTQSLRMTDRFTGHRASRDEMIQFLTAAETLAQSAIAGHPSEASLKAAQDSLPEIETELEKVRAEPANAHTKVTAYFYIDLDPNALGALLGPDRAAEYLDEWLETYGAPSARPADWATLSASDRYQWINDQAKANGDKSLQQHLKAAWAVIQAAADSESAFPQDRIAQAHDFVDRMQKISNLDLYPFVGMTRMSGAPAHLFLMTRLQIPGSKPNAISFASVGNQYVVPITMMSPGKSQ